MRRLVLVVLLGMLAVFLLACARPSVAPTPAEAFPAPVATYALDTTEYPDVGGRTGCDAAGHLAIYLKPGMSPAFKRYALAHEFTHVAQGMAFPSCAAFLERYRMDPAYAFASEASAYCAMWLSMAADGVATPAAWVWIIGTLQSYDPSLTMRETELLMPCASASRG
jgi:hypothetical protein